MGRRASELPEKKVSREDLTPKLAGPPEEFSGGFFMGRRVEHLERKEVINGKRDRLCL